MHAGLFALALAASPMVTTTNGAVEKIAPATPTRPTKSEMGYAVVHPGTPEISGPLTRAAIDRVIREQRLPALLYCYEHEILTEGSSFAGSLAVRFEIGAGGRITSTAIEDDTFASDAVGACVQKQLRTWRFPDPGTAPANVRYPFRFENPVPKSRQKAE